MLNSRGRSRLINKYLMAKAVVVSAGFADEFDRLDHLSLDDISEGSFLTEVGWVVFSAGMNERVVRSKFGDISEAYLNWGSAQAIWADRHGCVRRALQVFRHEGKVNAVVNIARRISESGYSAFKRSVANGQIRFLMTLPYMGPATAYHLAKNIGMDVAKPDRHLKRIATVLGHQCPFELCRVIADLVGDRVSVIDTVFWRYATLDPSYVATLAE